MYWQHNCLNIWLFLLPHVLIWEIFLSGVHKEHKWKGNTFMFMPEIWHLRIDFLLVNTAWRFEEFKIFWVILARSPDFSFSQPTLPLSVLQSCNSTYPVLEHQIAVVFMFSQLKLSSLQSYHIFFLLASLWILQDLSSLLYEDFLEPFPLTVLL